jgi:hypothetical protein
MRKSPQQRFVCCNTTCFRKSGGLNVMRVSTPLFRAAKSEALELNVKERIYLIITEIALKLAEVFVIDIEILYQHIATDNEELAKFMNIKNTLNAA